MRPRTNASPALGTSQFQIPGDDRAGQVGRRPGQLMRADSKSVWIMPSAQLLRPSSRPPAVGRDDRRDRAGVRPPSDQRCQRKLDPVGPALGLVGGAGRPPSVARSEANRTRTTDGNRSVAGWSRSWPAIRARDRLPPAESAEPT